VTFSSAASHWSARSPRVSAGGLSKGAFWPVVRVGLGVLAAACTTPPHPPIVDAADPAPVRCDSLPPPTDSVFRTIYLTLEAPLRKDTLPVAYTNMVLDALVHGFVAPRPLVMPAFACASKAVEGSYVPTMIPAALGEMTFTLDSGGRPADVHLTQSSLSPALDYALVAMSRGIDSAHPFPNAIGVTGPRRVKFFVALQSFRSAHDVSAPLFRVQMPQWRDGHTASALSQHKKAVYPWIAESAGLGDDVMIQFVIDETGHAIPSTIRLISGHYREFAESAVETIVQSRYQPGSIGRCAVQELVQQPYTFTIRR
jgi:hypothetical protein